MFVITRIILIFAVDMKKIFIFIWSSIFIAVACSSNKTTMTLEIIDSLIINEQYESADSILSEIDTSLLNSPSKAHYYLRQKQLACVLRKKDSINMLDSIVIPYYIEIGNKERLAEAYYYKAYDYLKVKNISEATTYYKRAEEFAYQTDNLRLKFKAAESLAYINSVSGNRLFQCEYLRKAIELAKEIDNKDWLAHTYIDMAYAQSKLDRKDSSEYYCQKAIELKEYVNPKDRLALLSDIAYTYKYSQPEKAKCYYEEALSLKEKSNFLGHLANIYYDEGNHSEAYRLWKKALKIDDNSPKDNFIYNLLTYDIEHGRTDSICQYVNEIIAIKDSIIDNLRNDTIKDLQLHFDHEVAMRKQEIITSNWQKGLLTAIFLITLLVAYIIIKRYREKIRMQDAQMQINDLMDQIRELEKSEEDNSAAIQKLNDQIKDRLNKEGALLKQGKMLYDQIKDGQTVIEWRKKDFELFINYYKAIDYKTVNRLEKTKRKEKLTPHKMFFLLLNEMGYDKKEIIRILGISETSINTLYF